MRHMTVVRDEKHDKKNQGRLVNGKKKEIKKKEVTLLPSNPLQ